MGKRTLSAIETGGVFFKELISVVRADIWATIASQVCWSICNDMITNRRPKVTRANTYFLRLEKREEREENKLLV